MSEQGNIPAKFFTAGLHESVDGMGVSVTITGPEGIETIVFTQDEAEVAWALIQRFAWKAAAINDQRRLDNDDGNW